MRVVDQGHSKCLHWLWGKTDFVSYFGKEDGVWRCQKVYIIKKGHRYEFAEISRHGIIFEETRWVREDDDFYIELPRHFSHYMMEISNDLLFD